MGIFMAICDRMKYTINLWNRNKLYYEFLENLLRICHQ